MYRALFIIVGDEVGVLRIHGPGQPNVSVGDVDS
jgi:hypothetical protein